MQRNNKKSENMKKIFVIFALIAAIALPSHAQDYTRERIIALCDKVLNTPYGSKDYKDTKAAYTTLIRWAAETDEIKIEIGPWIPLEGLGNEDGAAILGAYLAAEIKYLLVHKQKDSSLESAQATLRETLGYYRSANGNIKASKLLKDLDKMSEDELNSYVAQKFNANRSDDEQ